ncbi:MAG: (d)CMP kinase [Gammaproteobacteria bacterium]|nr:(d)CMP kinase [Gammaproteobacteria bacterium]MDE2344927.1 (d)CMP kinase [Gammaproteobacteria bacterium]
MNQHPAAPVIAIDGPSGSGKGTVSRRVAAALGWHFLDSGALYRILALASKQAQVEAADAERLRTLAAGLRIEFKPPVAAEEQILLNGRDVTQAVRSEECGKLASELAVIPQVRESLKNLQRSFCRAPGLVADGRDMGTVIFPDAGLKIYLTASPGERAQRRYNQLKEKGLNANLPALLRDIAARDARDQNRAVSPLKPAAEAVVLDTTGTDVEQVVATVLAMARSRLGLKTG